MPVGYVYISSDPTSPAALYGGTWEQLTDRVIVGAGGSYAVNSTGGEAVHTLTVPELPKHRHPYKTIDSTTGNTYDGGLMISSTNIRSYVSDAALSDVGGNMPHNNLQPYVAKYIWERVA